MSNLGVKRDEHRNRPQPTRDPADTVTVARTGAPSRSTTNQDTTKPTLSHWY
jgi:hypothetical protein